MEDLNSRLTALHNMVHAIWDAPPEPHLDKMELRWRIYQLQVCLNLLMVSVGKARERGDIGIDEQMFCEQMADEPASWLATLAGRSIRSWGGGHDTCERQWLYLVRCFEERND